MKRTCSDFCCWPTLWSWMIHADCCEDHCSSLTWRSSSLCQAVNPVFPAVPARGPKHLLWYRPGRPQRLALPPKVQSWEIVLGSLGAACVSVVLKEKNLSVLQQQWTTMWCHKTDETRTLPLYKCMSYFTALLPVTMVYWIPLNKHMANTMAKSCRHTDQRGFNLRCCRFSCLRDVIQYVLVFTCPDVFCSYHLES